MGGTLLDVYRYAGRFGDLIERSTSCVTIQAPQLNNNTVATGDGPQSRSNSCSNRQEQSTSRQLFFLSGMVF